LKRPDVAAIGPLNIDLLITGEGPANWEAIPTWDGPAQMEMTAAGSIGYTAMNLAKLGLEVCVSSCLPDDPLGVFVQNTLERAGVDTHLVRSVPDTVCGIGVYALLFGSRKRPLVYRLPTHDFWPRQFTPEEIETLLDARALHSGGYLHYKDVWHGATVDLYRQAKARGLLTAMDPQFPLFAMPAPWLAALDDVLPFVDILFCDEDEARNMTAESDLEAAARRLLDAGAGMVIIKEGERGSGFYRAGWTHRQEAVRLGEVVDTIGAGDTFDAGFLYGTLQGWPPERSALFASIAAGFSVTGVGGSNTMPGVERIMAEMGKLG
jgi:sugar/nucleoside kinase (ribokinase family)